MEVSRFHPVVFMWGGTLLCVHMVLACSLFFRFHCLGGLLTTTWCNIAAEPFCISGYSYEEVYLRVGDLVRLTNEAFLAVSSLW